jgi:divalent metal cation (Fe/Co/Zn/Cd) transporter
MKNEQKRDIWLLIGISFFAGIGFMSIVNIIKIVYNHHALVYDWIMFAVSIIIIVVCLILYLTKPGIALENKIKKYR